MIKDIFDSFKGHLHQKTTNPFFGTLIAIFIFRNWKIVYAIFNFEGEFTLSQKIDFISSNLNQNNIFHGLGLSILWTFFVLIVSYILLNLSRLIINFFEKRVTPKIYQITDSKDIVLKSVYDFLLIENEKLKTRYDNERDNRIRVEMERDEIEKKMIGMINVKNIEDTESQQKLENDNESTINEARFISIDNNLKQNKLFEEFESILEKIDNKKAFHQNNEGILQLIKIGILEKGGFVSQNMYQYKFSSEGMKYKKYYINKYILNK